MVTDLLVEQGDWTFFLGALWQRRTKARDEACGCLMVMEDVDRSHGVDDDWMVIHPTTTSKADGWMDGWMDGEAHGDGE